MSDIFLRLATTDDAAEMLRVIRAAFGARPPVDPPAAALSDDVSDIVAAIEAGAGVCAEDEDGIVGCLLLSGEGEVRVLRRVSVLPSAARNGVATALVTAALGFAASQPGARRAELLARDEFPQIKGWWRGHGFRELRATRDGSIMGRDLPVVRAIKTAAEMHALGLELATLLRPGDLILASGELGAGKTTLAQGIGAGLEVTGPVISPTFVLSRVHPATEAARPDFVHVDAYRLADGAELADIDLDASLPSSITLVEWGTGKAEWLSDDRLELTIERSPDPSDDTRTVVLVGIGPRWEQALESLRRG